MKWINDNSGRFKKRPHYSSDELDFECENIVLSFLKERHGKIDFPVTTEDLTVLMEVYTLDFDSSADLSDEGHDVEGVTYFQKGKKPTVKISSALSQEYLENRLRTTLTHELFHVCFHNFLYQTDESPSLFDLSPIQNDNAVHKCNRDGIINASKTDWMEWQAGYGCGAFLMPASELSKTVSQFRTDQSVIHESIVIGTMVAQNLISAVSQKFCTSEDAARVRLLQKEFLVQTPGQTAIKFT